MPHEISIAFQTNKTAAQYIALAKQVNEYDFDAVTVYCDAPFHPSYAPLMLMAPHIQKARIGPAAIAPSRIHPIDIASQTSLLTQIANGGVYVGISRGAWLADHGIAEDKPAIKAVREAVDVIRYLLAGETGGYSGDVYSLVEHFTSPFPVPDVDIPILIGSWGPKLCAVAGEIADELKIGGSANPDVVPVVQEYVAVGKKRARRDVNSINIVVGAVTLVDEDREQARTAARRSVALYMPIVVKLDPTVEVDTELLDRVQTYVNQKELDKAADLISDDLLDKFAFSGNASDLIQQAEALFDAGAKRVEFGTPHGLVSEKGIDLLGKQVVPAMSRWRT